MSHFNDVKGYRGPAENLSISGEKETKNSGVDRVGVKDVKTAGDTKDQRPSDYRGPAAKLKTE